MALEAQRLSVVPLISRLSTLSPLLSQPASSKCFGRRPRLLAISASLLEEREISFTGPEVALVEALVGIQGRGSAASAEQLKEVERAVEVLERQKGVADPVTSNLIEGCWQLIFTTRPGTASPIQIFQEVYLRTSDPRVTNIVQFSDQIGALKVEAAATIKDGRRILFQFDRAALSFKFLPFKIPYPVPFKLLGDEAKGWLDTTYLSTSGIMRISRGNKGTVFVLQKQAEPRQKLLSAVSAGEGGRVADIINEVISSRQHKVRPDLEAVEGGWQLLWSSQAEDHSWQDVVANGFKGLQIVKKNGKLENLVNIFPGFRLCAYGSIMTEGNKFKVNINTGAVLAGSLTFSLEIKSSYDMELLYIDNKIRISRLNDGTLLIHMRITNPN